jgi:hypothetical protein
VIALGLSLLANLAVLASVGFAAMESAKLRKKSPPAPAPPAQSVAMIFPEMAPSRKATDPQPVTPSAATMAQRFARTSEDQSTAPEKKPAFMGERNTRATSDRTADPTAPPLPSQAGLTPKNEMEIETTESTYQDGRLESAPNATLANATPTPASSTPPDPAPASAAAALENPDRPEPDTAASSPPPREKLLDGPHPVDLPVPRENVKDKGIKPTPEHRSTATRSPKSADLPKPQPSREPGFKGFQRKTAVTGSISRNGRSALDVEDSPLGRYQATLSRAVEQEWQRNCVRHRDFITPGFLTVRFFVEPGGKVRSVQFVGDMETGEVQKGFTLNSIRNAAIPAMPPALRKQYDQEPLELVFRFYF